MIYWMVFVDVLLNWPIHTKHYQSFSARKFVQLYHIKPHVSHHTDIYGLENSKFIGSSSFSREKRPLKKTDPLITSQWVYIHYPIISNSIPILLVIIFIYIYIYVICYILLSILICIDGFPPSTTKGTLASAGSSRRRPNSSAAWKCKLQSPTYESVFVYI